MVTMRGGMIEDWGVLREWGRSIGRQPTWTSGPCVASYSTEGSPPKFSFICFNSSLFCFVFVRPRIESRTLYMLGKHFITMFYPLFLFHGNLGSFSFLFPCVHDVCIYTCLHMCRVWKLMVTCACGSLVVDVRNHFSSLFHLQLLWQGLCIKAKALRMTVSVIPALSGILSPFPPRQELQEGYYANSKMFVCSDIWTPIFRLD